MGGVIEVSLNYWNFWRSTKWQYLVRRYVLKKVSFWFDGSEIQKK